MNYTVRFVLMLTIIAASIVSFRSVENPISQWSKHNDYAHYYISSLLFKSKVDPYSQIDDLYNQLGLINQPRIDQGTNPPALVLFNLPLTFLPAQTSFWIWTSLSLVSLFGCLYFFLSKLNLDFIDHILLNLLVLVSFPVVAHLERGQAQLIILGLIILGFKLAQKSPLLSSFLWGMTSSLKIFTFALIYPSYKKAGVKGFFSFLFGFALPFFIFFIFSDFQTLSDFFSNALPYVQLSTLQFNGANSLSLAIVNTVDQFSIFEPKNFWMVNSLSLLIMILAIYIYDNYFWQKFDLMHCIATILVLSCLLSPTTWNHYLVLNLPALGLLFRAALEKRIHLINVLIAFILYSFSQGRLTNVSLEWQLISFWWGPIAMLYLLACLKLVTDKRHE